AAGQNLAAIFGDDRRHAIRVFLVLGGIVDLGTRDPIGWHKFPFRFFVMPAHTRLQNGVASFAYGGHPCLLIDSLETKVVDGRNKCGHDASRKVSLRSAAGGDDLVGGAASEFGQVIERESMSTRARG